MSQHPVRRAATGAVLLLLVGCSGTSTVEAPVSVAALGSTSQPGVASSAPSGSSSVAADLSRDPLVLSEPAVPTPRSSSGALDSATVPAASALGPGWAARVEGDNVEEGPGNGTPYQERDPADVVQATIPLGCARRSGSPVPRNVLQATYRHPSSGAYAVVLRMRFASRAQARRFVALRHADLVACERQPDDPYSGAPAPVRAAVAEGHRTIARYVLAGERLSWRTGARVDGRDVLTLDSDARPVQRVSWEELGFLSP